MESRPVKSIIVKDRIRKDFGDLDKLANSISELGLLQPIGVTKELELVFGERRLRAVRDILRWPDISIREVNLEAIILGEHAENEVRKDFTPSERVEIGKKIEAWLGNRQGQRTDIQLRRHGGEVEVGQGERTDDVAAKRAGFGSGDSYRRAKEVVEYGAPELVEAMDAGRASIKAAAEVAALPAEEQKQIVARGEREILNAAKKIRAERQEERRQERLTKIAKISAATVQPLTSIGRYPLIYADPPWLYEFCSDDADNLENHYPTMTLDALCALPVAEATTDDCILFLWCTSPKLEESLRVINAWGFSYRSCAVWDKQWIGQGYYFRQIHEFLLVAVKGALPVPAPSNRPPSIFSEKRTEHSRKPQIAYELIEQMYPEIPKLELFARTAREGWQAWGYEAGEGGPNERL